MTAYYNEINPTAAQWLRNLIAGGHIASGVVDERSIEDVIPDELREFTQCHICAGPIVKGEEHRSARYKFDGEIMGYRCCNTCCIAMASSVCCDYIGDEDDGDSDDVDPIDARYSLGDKRRNHGEGDGENVAGSH